MGRQEGTFVGFIVEPDPGLLAADGVQHFCVVLKGVNGDQVTAVLSAALSRLMPAVGVLRSQPQALARHMRQTCRTCCGQQGPMSRWSVA